MKLEVGNIYKDSQGRVIEIISDVASLPFCYIGEVLFTGELLRYSHDGTIYGSNDINLVKELGTTQKMEGVLSFGSRLKDFKDIILQDAAFEDEEPRKYKYRIIVEEIEE